MGKSKRSSQNSESGVAAVEMAIILPVLFLILFGIINFGTVFYNYIVITNAAREGARWGSIHLAQSEVTNPPSICSTSSLTSTAPLDKTCVVTNQHADNLLISYGSSAKPKTTATLDTSGEFPLLSVAITYDYKGISFFQTLFADGLSASSKMYLEPES